MTDLSNNIMQIVYFAAALLFVFGLKKMSSPITARKGLGWASIAMLVAVVITLLHHEVKSNFTWMTIALFVGGVAAYSSAKKSELTSMPKMIALYNGLGAGAAAGIAAVQLLKLESLSQAMPDTVKFAAAAGALIACISFSGSIVAFLKLHGMLKVIRFPMHQWGTTLALVIALTFGVAIVLNGDQFEVTSLIIFFILALTVGKLITIPLNNEDMPVLISLFNTLTGLAVGLGGYALSNLPMVVGGFLVAATGLTLTLSMGKALNRPISQLLFGNYDETSSLNKKTNLSNGSVRELQANDAAMMMAFSQNVIIVPGYGMALSQSQHRIQEVSRLLKNNDVNVKFAIHPAAGRMPGHMNVLLAETNISDDSIYDLDEINEEFSRADVVLVLGANDTTNPSARTDKNSSIFNMPILNADKAKNVIVIKRGKGTGFSGIDNPLFYQNNTALLFGDAQSVLADIIRSLREI